LCTFVGEIVIFEKKGIIRNNSFEDNDDSVYILLVVAVLKVQKIVRR